MAKDTEDAFHEFVFQTIHFHILVVKESYQRLRGGQSFRFHAHPSSSFSLRTQTFASQGQKNIRSVYGCMAFKL
jgi:hypothetical protein